MSFSTKKRKEKEPKIALEVMINHTKENDFHGKRETQTINMICNFNKCEKYQQISTTFSLISIE